MHSKLLPLLVTVSLSACSTPIVPGMYMGTTSGESNVEVPVLESGELVTSKAIITPITADLIIQQTAEARRQTATTKVRLPKQHTPYQLGPGDVLNITVWDHPELTIPAGEYRTAEAAGNLISTNGTIFYPYVGVLKVTGMTVTQLRDILTKRLSHYIENPQLDVRVAAFRSQNVYVVGEVSQPGVQSITDIPLTVADAINHAGGVLTSGILTKNADMTNVTVSRAGKVFKVDLVALYEKGDLSQNLLLQDGDVVNVPDNSQNRVFVLGQVLNPISVPVDRGHLTLAEALGDAGGVNPLTSNAGHVYVIRSGREKPEIFYLDAKSPDVMLLADRFNMVARDVVWVDPATVTQWNTVITQILPSASVLNLTTGNVIKR